MPKKKRKIIDVFPKPRDSSSAWSSNQTYLFHKGQGSWRGDGEGEGHHQSQQQLQLQLRLQDLHHHQRHHCHHCQRVIIWSLSPAPPITLVYGAITEPETIKILFGWFWRLPSTFPPWQIPTMVGFCPWWWWWESVSDKIPPLMMMMMMIKSNSCIKGVGTYASRTFATSFVVTSRYLPPPFCDICHPYFRTIATPKINFWFFSNYF